MDHADTSDLRRRKIEGSAHINTAEGHQNKVTVTSSLNLASTCSCALHLPMPYFTAESSHSGMISSL